MDKQKCFHMIFRRFINIGSNAYARYFEKHSAIDWEHFLFDNDNDEHHTHFILGFLYYLDLAEQPEFNRIIGLLRTRVLEEKQNKKSRSYQLAFSLAEILHARTFAQIDSKIKVSIPLIEQEVNKRQDSIINFLYPSNFSTYPSFLICVIAFLVGISPKTFCSSIQDIRPFFSVVVVCACSRYKLWLPDDEFFYRALSFSDSGIYYLVTEACYNHCVMCHNYQDAYDVLFSWIHKRMVGKFSEIQRDFTIDKDWRKQNTSHIQHFYLLMCSLCSSIADFQHADPSQRESFQLESSTYAKKLLKEKDVPMNVYSLCMSTLLHHNEYEICNRHLEQFLDLQPHIAKLEFDLPVFFFDLISCKIGLMCEKKYAGQLYQPTFFRTILDKPMQKLQSLLEEFCHLLTSDYLRSWREYYSNQRTLDINHMIAIDQAFSICTQVFDSHFEKDSRIAAILLCIRHLVLLIKQELRYPLCTQTYYDTRKEIYNNPPKTCANENMPIAYYTTLDNLKYLLEPVYVKDITPPLAADEITYPFDFEDSKNCLTMMHAHYMNDPAEGISLLETLSSWIESKSIQKNILFQKNTPSVFREQILDNQFVFLKSFTNVIDQLNMWGIYGSDRNSGSDSNGCCVCIAPETFEMMLSVPLTKNHQYCTNADDLRLYHVAYLHDGHLEGISKPSSLIHYFELLKLLVQDLNDTLAIHSSTAPSVKQISSILQDILSPIVFLFKDASYRAEHELRLIVTRSRKPEDLALIRKTPQNPPKLYINPYHQVYVNQIILGPKVRQPDNWIPHLQYELTKMWESWPENKYKKRIPSVRKSNINYRD